MFRLSISDILVLPIFFFPFSILPKNGGKSFLMENPMFYLPSFPFPSTSPYVKWKAPFFEFLSLKLIWVFRILKINPIGRAFSFFEQSIQLRGHTLRLSCPGTNLLRREDTNIASKARAPNGRAWDAFGLIYGCESIISKIPINR